MAGKRVRELAKEYEMDTKELLSKLKELGIPAKTHASVLSDEDIEALKEQLDPEIKQRAGQLDNEEAQKLEEEKQAQAERDALEAAERKAAVEQERALREAERARREKKKAQVKASNEAASEEIDLMQEVADQLNLTAHEDEVPSADEEQEPKHSAKASTSHFAQLENQIEEARKRAEREEYERKLKAQQDRIAREVAKKQAVEARLAAKKAPASATKASSSTEEAKPVAPKAPSFQKSNRFDSLLSQIASEQDRIKEEQQNQANKKQEAAKHNQKSSKKRTYVNPDLAPQKQGNVKGSTHSFEPDVPELQSEQVGEDRYAQMAVQAEKFQRDKVLAEARAAVEAAHSDAGEGRRKKRKEKREQEARQKAELEALEKGLDPSLVLDESLIEIPQGATVSKFAELLGVQPNDVIKRLFMLGQVLTLTQSMSDELIELIADDMKRKVRVVSPEEEYAQVFNDLESDLVGRPPVVTVMGHVDHGKTSLLDAIRHTGVATGEAGGITQHIGASVVFIDDRQITFIDTPGHEAFTAMRARGAQVTDVIVLVVAADDGVMPQTIEAINHAKAANVPIVVAVNKIDKPGANPDRVRQELVEHGVIPEEWGGTNMFVEVSAKQKLHIDDLLETILLQADVLELKANPDAFASGFVIEANLDKGRGPVATVLVQRGTLKPGDSLVAGCAYGRVRALLNPRGQQVSEAKPADPVEILGLGSVPTAGDEFRVFEDERDARKLAEQRQLRARLAEQEFKSHMSLDDLFNRIEAGKQTDLNLIVKADVQGSIEALRDAFEKMDQSEVRINIVHSAVGGITETDVTLAAASDAIIIGFNVRPTGKSKQQAEKEKVDIRLYRVIYQAIEDINAARVGLLSPDIVEKDTGIAQVRDTFKVPKVGTIAGCYITEGEISRDDKVRIVRDGTVIFEGSIDSLRRFKDDVKSVKQGYECGIGIQGYQDIKVGDSIEGYRVIEVERTE